MTEKKHQVEVLKAHQTFLDFQYSKSGLIRISMLILMLGIITYALSSEQANQNEIFGWMTLAQGTVVAGLFVLVKYKNQNSLLLLILLSYLGLWIVELVIWGYPNNLLKGYYEGTYRSFSATKHNWGPGASGIIGLAFPYVYLGVKLAVGYAILTAYIQYFKFNRLPQEIKLKLQNLK